VKNGALKVKNKKLKAETFKKQMLFILRPFRLK